MRRKLTKVITGVWLCAVLFMASGFLCSAEYESGTYTEKNPDTGYRVVLEDDADLLTEEQEDDLATVMMDITAYGNVAFKSLNLNSDSTDSYAEYYYEKLFDNESGTLFLIDMDNRMLYLYSDGSVYKVVTKGYANTITDNVYRYASDEEYYKCAQEVYGQIFALLEGDRIAQPMKYISNALLAMILALIFNFGIVNYFTKIRKPDEDEILTKADVYFNCSKLRSELTHQTKTYEPVSSSSGGRSGGSSGGGSSSSGGGGGHRF